MSEQPEQPEKKEKDSSAKEDRQSLLLSLVQYGSKPAGTAFIGFLVLAWLYPVREPLLDIFRQARNVKVGSFEISLRETALRADVADQLEALAKLDDVQLQLFLVIGKKRSHITYRGEEVTDFNLDKLLEVGLLEEWEDQEDGMWWRVSEKGARLHDIVRNLIFSSIRKSGEEQPVG